MSMESFQLIIFGITGNLSQIKVIPSLYDLQDRGIFPENISIIGVGRKPFDNESFKKYFYDVLHQENRHHKHSIDDQVWEKLSKRLEYVSGDLNDPQLYKLLDQKGKDMQIANRIVYLATYPDLYQTIFSNVSKSGLSSNQSGWFRLLIEKPIGTDLESSTKLNKLLSNYFSNDQVFRLDHYLGKETLQNILTFRFGNGLFEPLLNKDYIDNIQITSSEDFGIGKRGGYYDTVGCLKDVGQNHSLQMLTAITMDAPDKFSNESVTKERIKILEKLIPDPKNIYFGQYEGYKKEDSVDPNSQTDTFFSLKCSIDNERFAGVPIYIRAGKMMAETVTEISVVFKVPVNRLFTHLDHGSDPNVLIFRVQPNEGVVLRTLTKTPGHSMDLDHTYMQFCYRDISSQLPDPYERLIADAVRGDQTFFNDPPEVELQWKFIDELIKARNQPEIYKCGSWGVSDPFPWLTPSPAFCRF